jgi:hypothetical protein
MNTLIKILRKIFCLQDDSSEARTYYTSQPMSEPTKRYVPFSEGLSEWGSIRSSAYGTPSVVLSPRYGQPTHNSAKFSSPEVRVNIGGLQGYTTARSSAGSHQYSYTSESGLPALGSMNSMYYPRRRAANYPNIAEVGNYFP